jgi:acetylornithine deacetylase/succinyl-diaminopimelate desuccinylase-like protein
VKLLIDSEEEKNSPGIGAVATANRDLLRADGFVINDGPMHESNQPTLVFGNRGDASLRLTVYGAKSNLHSGHYGNYAPNPAQRLASLLASMKADDGRVLVAGYYDRVKLTEADRAMLKAVPDDEAALRRRLGIAKPEAVGGSYQEALQYPSLNIRGLSAAAVGDKAANIIPSKAVAELEMRTVPGTDADTLAAAIERHIRSKGYYLSKGEPTDEERAKYDRIASIARGPSSRATLADTNSALAKWADVALARTFATNGKPGRVVRIRMSGATVPTDKLVDALKLPFVAIPLVNGDNNQHSFDENIRIGHLFSGTRAFIGLLTTPL